MKIKVLESEFNKHLERAYHIKLIGKTFEAEKGKDYYFTEPINGREFLIYKDECKEVLNVNKTNITNSIQVLWNTDKKKEDVKEVLKVKRLLKERSVKYDIESIEYNYNKLIRLYIAACHQLKDYCLVNILENTVKLILETDIKIDPYNKEVARRLLKYS